MPEPSTIGLHRRNVPGHDRCRSAHRRGWGPPFGSSPTNRIGFWGIESGKPREAKSFIGPNEGLNSAAGLVDTRFPYA